MVRKVLHSWKNVLLPFKPVNLPSLDQIRAPIAIHIDAFEDKFREVLRSNVPLLDTIMRYIVRRKGKQMRPMFVFLAAGTVGNIGESAYNGATLIELLHTATLVNDDVVDDSNLRRGFFSVNALWKNKIAVLAGDYLLSRGMLLALNKEEYHLLKIVSDAVKEMSEGELLQIEKARRMDIREEVYYEIIRKKTASLIASCCACGAASTGAGHDVVTRMWSFGELAGIAFQIKDDIFDYQKGNFTGKPSGTDIRDQKMTLPIIFLLRQANRSEKRWIISTVKNHHHDTARVNQLVDMVYERGGISYARGKMTEYRDNSLRTLRSFPESEFRTALEEMVVYTTERNK